MWASWHVCPWQQSHVAGALRSRGYNMGDDATTSWSKQEDNTTRNNVTTSWHNKRRQHDMRPCNNQLGQTRGKWEMTAQQEVATCQGGERVRGGSGTTISNRTTSRGKQEALACQEAAAWLKARWQPAQENEWQMGGGGSGALRGSSTPKGCKDKRMRGQEDRRGKHCNKMQCNNQWVQMGGACCAHGNNLFGYKGWLQKIWYLKPTKVHIFKSIEVSDFIFGLA